MNGECPLLAQSRHELVRRTCPLLGGKADITIAAKRLLMTQNGINTPKSQKRRLVIQNDYEVFFDARASSVDDRVGALRLALAERDVLAGNLVQCDEHVVRCNVSGDCDARVDVFQKCKPCLLWPPLDKSDIENNQIVGVMHSDERRRCRKRFFGNSKISW